MKKEKRIFFAVLSGVLLSAGWYEWASGLILLFALVPLLHVENYLVKNKDDFKSVAAFGYAFITFITWNILTTWWIINASFAGLLMAILINTSLMSAVFWIFHYARRKIGTGAGYFSLIVFWLYFEYFYLNAEISWPWLTLGNGFAFNPVFVQWYEYTGVLGGSFWILLVNILFIKLLSAIKVNTCRSGIARILFYLLLVISVPIIYSILRYNSYHETSDPREIIVVQPNIDPYREKFGGMESELQTRKLLNLAEELVDSTIDYVVAPETALNNNIWLEQLHQNPVIKMVYEFLQPFPDVKFIVGITAYKRYQNPEEKSPTSRQLGGTSIYYDSFNSAIQIDSTDNIQLYHKSMLVVGVEKMPYPRYLRFLERLTLRLGGTFRSHGTQDYRGVFFSPGDSTGVAPVICYESVFGEFVTGYIRAGANLIFVITNDGWWGDTPGYRQHNALSRLRAIETRRSIARSANTGISCFINQRGDIYHPTSWWVPASIKHTLNANDVTTFT
ncbi:MAG: apolipoprotein N-acyltransferase [Bacteroidales bacterium]